MRKFAIFTEGQSELIFVRELLLRYVDASKMWLLCQELLSHRYSDVGFEYKCPKPEIFILLVDVHGDEGVLSSIKEREKGLIDNGRFERIIGLRDMHCELYLKKSPDKINVIVSEMIVQNSRLVIQNMCYSDKIKVCFAVMELEAWFLGMYNLFKRINPILNIDYIRKHTGIDLKEIDPEKIFYQPSREVNTILNLCGMEYKKKKREVENIARNMTANDFGDARENNRCEHLDEFITEIKGIACEYLYE